MADGVLGASFRDPSGFVFSRGGVLHRQVNRVHAPHYERLMGSGLYADLVAQLPAVEREACTLVYIQGMSPAQAAVELATTPNNIHQRLFHARRRLKETIGGDG